MRSKLVYASHQEPYAVWPLAVVLCIRLRAVANHVDYSFDWDWSAVCHLRGERLLLHEVGQHSGVGGQTGESQAKVVI